MTDVKIKREGEHRLVFIVEEGAEQIAEMIAGVSGDTMTIYHTGVEPEYEGRGLAKKLFDAMIVYAREHKLQVNPVCPYVRSQLLRHPEEFRDIWTDKERDSV